MGLHATNVTMSDLIFGVDRHRERLNGRETRVVELFNVLVGVFHPTHCGLESEIQHE